MMMVDGYDNDDNSHSNNNHCIDPTLEIQNAKICDFITIH